MKWPTDPMRPCPNLDDTRKRKVFAWLPRKCEDGYTRWLTWVWRVEVWRKGLPLLPPPNPPGGYSAIPWVVGWYHLRYEAIAQAPHWPLPPNRRAAA